MRWAVLVACVAVGSALASQAQARPASFTVALAPLRRILPVVEVVGEARIGDQVGLSVVAGAGEQTTETNIGFGTRTATAKIYEGAIAAHWYAEGFDEGMHFGAEVRVFHKAAPSTGGTGSQVVQIGGYGGYKHTWWVGRAFGLFGAGQIG